VYSLFKRKEKQKKYISDLNTSTNILQVSNKEHQKEEKYEDSPDNRYLPVMIKGVSADMYDYFTIY
jgi:hypothetical protein